MVDKHGKFFMLYIRSIDVLIKLSYMELEEPINESDKQYYQYVRHHYYALITTLRSSMILFEYMHYDSALRIVRGLFETLVKIKYFLHHKDDLLPYEKSHGKNLRIKRIFNEVVGNDTAYNQYYGFLCRFVHDNIDHKIETTERRYLNEQHIMIPSYDEQLVAAYINFTIYILLGYLNLFQQFLNIDEQMIIKDLSAEYLGIKNDLIFVIKKQKIQFEQQKEFHQIFSKIVDIEL